MPAFTVTAATVFGPGTLRVVADFNANVNAATAQPTDLVIDGSLAAVAVTVIDADTLQFDLPTLAAGTHTLTIDPAALLDTSAVGISAFSSPLTIAAASQYTMKHNPRLQPGNAPLVGFAGSELDRVDILWQTIPSGAGGTQDSFTVEYRAVGAATWQTTTLNAAIDTGLQSRFVRSASITGLQWNADYEYRVRQRQGDVIVGEYQSDFHTRLQAGDPTNFSFAAYGDSASGTATGFKQVQSRINAIDPAFSVLLGDNVYTAGSHIESDARFDPLVNPPAAAWMAGHIDYLGLGNHDVGTSSGLPSEQNYSVPIPVAGVTSSVAPPASERPEHSFSWDYGDVHFVTFDTNALGNAAASMTRLDGLLKWVVADLNASTARWKIVYGHHPVSGTPDKTETPSDNYYQQVVNRLKAAGADLFMTGHSHTYSWTYPLTGQINGTATYINHGVDDHFHAGEGLPQLVSGMGGVELRSGDYNQFPFVAEGFTTTTAIPSRLGFSKVDVTQDQLTVSYIAADDGSVIDSFTISKDPDPQTVSFQQGVSGYSSTTDTQLVQNAPTTNYAGATTLLVDTDDPSGTLKASQGLLRFDDLFGAAPGQIPLGATIRSATLQVQVSNESLNNMNLHRMLAAWSPTDTWDSKVGGIQNNGAEAAAAPDSSSGRMQVGTTWINVLPSLQAWQLNPAANFGWAILPTGTDGVIFDSSEGAAPPKLIVTYVLPTGPNDAPVAVNDSATTTLNTPVTVAVLGNDSDANSDPLFIAATTAPAHGTVSITGLTSILYTPTTGYTGYDTFSYTISDSRGGTATGIVTVAVAQTVVFQQGVNGYSGTSDTYLQQNPTNANTNNAAATSLNVDGDDPSSSGNDVQALLKFADIFGPAAGQIPTMANIVSAALQLNATNAGNGVNFHRMLIDWTPAATWTSLVGGVQNNGVEAVATADLSSSAVAVALTSFNVLTSLLAWQNATAANFGWAILPTGSDGIDFDSAEGTTKPKLTVAYTPANAPPAISDVGDQATGEDLSLGPIAFTIGDAETPADLLAVSAASSNVALLPNANLSLAGSGANRTLTLIPAADQFGSATITLSITDSLGSITTDTFVLTVTPALPTVASLTPALGPTTGGAIVVITGTDFVGVTSVTFGGLNAATFTVNSDSQITATAPAHAAATVDVVLFNSAGSSPTAAAADNFTFTPTVASVAVNGGPNVVLSGTGSTVSLAGQNSVVRQILVTFNQDVSVASDAFTVTPRGTNVTVHGGASPSSAAVTASATMVTPSSFLVTFSGPGTNSGIIASGIYDLTTLGAKVSAGGDTMAGNRTDTFFAMFGTVDPNNSYTAGALGDGQSHAFVDPGSLFAFSDAFGAISSTPAGPPAYNLRFDSNLDGSIDPGDLFAFSDTFGVDWTF